MTDAIAILEVAYALAGDEGQWLQRIVHEALPSLQDGHGVCGWTYDASRPDDYEVRTTANRGAHPDLVAAGSRFDRSLPEGVRRAIVRMYRTGFVGTLTCAPAALSRKGLDAGTASLFQGMLDQFLRGWSFDDALWVNAQDPTHVGCLLVAPLRRERRSNPREVHSWRRIAAHLSAAFRIRRQFAAASTAAQDAEPLQPEAILRPDGRLEHAEEPAQGELARDALRRAALSFDRARGSLRRRDPQEALSIWQALVAGRWSLVDRFDSDGRRFVVAHRNDARVPDMRGLSLRERQTLAYAALGHSNKVIAYELGLSISTVAGHLARARAKLRTSLGAAASPGN